MATAGKPNIIMIGVYRSHGWRGGTAKAGTPETWPGSLSNRRARCTRGSITLNQTETSRNLDRVIGQDGVAQLLRSRGVVTRKRVRRLGPRMRHFYGVD